MSIAFALLPKDYNKKIKQGNLLEIKKIFVALAGPITNIFVMLIVLQMNMNILGALMILYSNLLLILFNLLPIYPLDGGRVIKGIFHIFLGKRKAEKYSNHLSFVTLLLVTFIASIAVYQTENIAIFLIVLVLWGIFIKEDRRYERKNQMYRLLDKV